MLRDQLAKNHVDLLERTRDEKAQNLADLDDRLRRGDDTVHDRRRHAAEAVTLVTAMYSLGAPNEEMEARAKRIPEILATTRDRLFKPTKSGGSISTLLDVGAFVALFEDQVGAQKLIEVVDRFDVEDFLLDSYIGSVTEHRKPSQKLQMVEIAEARRVKNPPLYAGQKEAAELALEGDHAGAADRLARYVTSEWYSSHASDFDWVPPEQARRAYAGHWCFTAAATAKVYEIDDATLQGHERYPWELAHPSD